MHKVATQYIYKYAEFLGLERIGRKISEADIHVVGASGALGVSLLFLIEALGWRPRKLTLYVRDLEKSEQLIKLKGRSNLKFDVVTQDQESREYSFNLINEESTVFFMVGYAQPMLFLQDPRALFDINVKMLGSVIDRNPLNIFYASSSELYAGIDRVDSESSFYRSNPQDVRGAYIESKRAGEALISHCRRSNHQRWVSFRIALATPPWHFQNDRRVLSDLLSSAISGQGIRLKGGEQSVRQYQYGPVMMAKLAWAGFFGKGFVYNLAGGEHLTLEEIAICLADVFNTRFFARADSEKLELGAPKSVFIENAALNGELRADDAPVEKFEDLARVIKSLSIDY